MTSTTTATTFTRSAQRTILQSRPRLRGSLRLVPVALVLLGAASLPSPAGATSCHPGNLAISGGTVTNQTTLAVSADGGVAVANAEGGNHNTATGGAGGAQGDGGNANAGNGGLAAADAAGGMIDLDDINSGNNRGNTIAVSGGARCGGNLLVDGGTVRNDTTIALSANGGVAVSNANGGNHNTATGGAGGAQGNGGNANAGNGGIASADASGGAITVGDVNSGNNRGTTIVVGLGGYFGAGANARIDGGTVSNQTTLAVSADGGTAVANANGGNNNTATGGNGGAQGNGGTANAGNGGIAAADASGGAVAIGDVNSGNNRGNTIAVAGSAASSGNVIIDGGTVSNETTIAVSADGGTAVAQAEGGNNNTATGGNGGAQGDGGEANAGNGGIAAADASGGAVSIGDVNSGGNSGNTIVVGP